MKMRRWTRMSAGVLLALVMAMGCADPVEPAAEAERTVKPCLFTRSVPPLSEPLPGSVAPAESDYTYVAAGGDDEPAGQTTFAALGAVLNPGTYHIPRPDMRLLDAISIARGVTNPATEWVYVIRPLPGAETADEQATGETPEAEARLIAIDLKRLFAGDPRMNVLIRPGDMVHVPTVALGEFYVMGEVTRPGVYDLTDRPITIKIALAAAGNMSAVAWPEHSVLIRRVGENQEQIIPIDIEKIYRGEETDIVLKAGDVISVGTFVGVQCDVRGSAAALSDGGGRFKRW